MSYEKAFPDKQRVAIEWVVDGKPQPRNEVPAQFIYWQPVEGGRRLVIRWEKTGWQGVDQDGEVFVAKPTAKSAKVITFAELVKLPKPPEDQ